MARTEDLSMLRKVIPVILTLFLLAPAGAAVAQDATAQEPQVPETPKDVRPKGGNSFVDDVFQNIRHAAGFSLGAYESYFSDMPNNAGPTMSGPATALVANVFLNLGRRRARFHTDFSMGYWIYNKHKQGGPTEQRVQGQYGFQTSRRTSILFSDELSSSPNWYGSFLGPVLGQQSPIPGFSTEVFPERQRITRNVASGTFGYQPTRKVSLGVTAGYVTYLFGREDIGRVNALQLGATYDHQLTNWLSLSNGFSTYLNRVDERFQDARIHRLQVGGFKFRLGRAWTATVGGGVEYLDTAGLRQVGESVTAALSWGTLSHTMSLNYHRGFFSAIGLARVFQSDQAMVAFGSRLSRWINLQLSSSYMRGSGVEQSGSLEYLLAHAGLEFALPADLVASLGGMYVNQRGHDMGTLSMVRERYIVSAGLQYVFPGRGR